MELKRAILVKTTAGDLTIWLHFDLVESHVRGFGALDEIAVAFLVIAFLGVVGVECREIFAFLCDVHAELAVFFILGTGPEAVKMAELMHLAASDIRKVKVCNTMIVEHGAFGAFESAIFVNLEHVVRAVLALSFQRSVRVKVHIIEVDWELNLEMHEVSVHVSDTVVLGTHAVKKIKNYARAQTYLEAGLRSIIIFIILAESSVLVSAEPQQPIFVQA